MIWKASSWQGFPHGHILLNPGVIFRHAARSDTAVLAQTVETFHLNWCDLLLSAAVVLMESSLGITVAKVAVYKTGLTCELRMKGEHLLIVHIIGHHLI